MKDPKLLAQIMATVMAYPEAADVWNRLERRVDELMLEGLPGDEMVLLEDLVFMGLVDELTGKMEGESSLVGSTKGPGEAASVQ